MQSPQSTALADKKIDELEEILDSINDAMGPEEIGSFFLRLDRMP